MKLTIVTPERVVFEEDDVEAVYAKTTDGEIGILPRHVPLVSPLDIGVLRYVRQGQKYPVAVMGGIIRTNGTAISVLTTAAEQSDEIDTLRAQEAKKRAEHQLNQLLNETKLEAVGRQDLKDALRRANTRLQIKQG